MNLELSNSCSLILAASYTNYLYSKNNKKRYFYLNSGSSLAIEKISNFYNKYKIPIFVAVDDDQKIPDFEAFKYCTFLKVPRNYSVFDTLKFSINEINKLNYKNVTLNPIQVIPSRILDKESISLSKSLFRKGNWSAVEINSQEINFIYRDDKSKEGSLAYAFTGRINARVSHIKNFLKKSNSYEYKDLGYLAFHLYKNFNYKFQHEIWFDLTHDALLTETKLSNVGCRNFHSISYCKVKNAITKEHSIRDSFNDTISYYEKLENKVNIKRFFPALLDVSPNNEISSYTLEYIPFPTLSELFLHECLDFHIWERIIQQFKNIFDEIYPNSKGVSGLSSGDFFCNKFSKRKELLMNLFLSKKYSNLKEIYFKPYKVNSIHMPPLQNTFQNLLEFLSKIEASANLWFGHGDLCFNNILIDPYSLTTKLIDPKALNTLGKEYVGFVPKNYDLAKLNHSFVGLYDSIIANMYSIKIMEGNNYKLNIFHPNKYSFIQNMFEQIFLESNKDLISEINFITANLFFSMLPLHSEDPNRMLALALVGNAFFEVRENFSSNIFK